MKTKLILFLALAFVMLSFNGCGDDKKCEDFTGWKRLGLKGKVKTMTTETYKGLDVSKYNDLEPHPMMEYYLGVVEYNINGEVTSQNLFDSNGLFQIFSFDYDNKHRETKMTVCDKSRNIMAIEYYKYNEKENQVECSVFKLDDQLHEVLSREERYIYNEKCNRTMITVYNNAAVLTSETARKFDEFGFLKEEVVSEASESHKLTYVYDNDNFGNWLTKKVVANGEFKGEKLDGFDVNNYSAAYTYDSMGNWLTAQIYLNSIPFQFCGRTIAYW